MSIWQNIKAEDLDLDGDEINIHYDDDSSGALYLVVKVKDIKKLLTVPNERNEESAVKKELERVCNALYLELEAGLAEDIHIKLRELFEQAIQAERTRIIKAIKGLKVEESGHDKVLRVRYNHAINQAIKAVGESAANSARKESK